MVGGKADREIVQGVRRECVTGDGAGHPKGMRDGRWGRTSGGKVEREIVQGIRRKSGTGDRAGHPEEKWNGR